MNWLRQLFSKLFSKKQTTDWASLDYGKPSTAGDDLRDKNNV